MSDKNPAYLLRKSCIIAANLLLSAAFFSKFSVLYLVVKYVNVNAKIAVNGAIIVSGNHLNILVIAEADTNIESTERV